MSRKYIVLTDVNGKSVTVDTVDIYSELQTQDFTIFGLDLAAVVELKRQYELRDGVLPATVGSIREIFGDRDE